MNRNSDNSLAAIASKYVNSTNRNIFLTGRAGTGKTTFLKSIVEKTHKKVVVAAPTGIAAINAGGITLHSLFHLPFGAFVPDNSFSDSGNRAVQINTPRSLIAAIKMNTHKRQLIKELELLIIDEVSMLRADLLDAIDTILRHIRRKQHLVFGGVQILFIGDLLQLPPVVKHEEWSYLNAYYRGAFFFESKAIQQSKPIYIELDKIYRQTDATFISVLNNLRDNKTTVKDVETLNKHYSPEIESGAKDGYIFITTHNRKAENINKKELDKLKSKSFFYNGITSGDFQESSYPIEYSMELKEGAQVMFIKNDPSPERLYYNGKIGKISSLGEEDIEVSFDDGTPDVLVEKYTWENKRYSLDKETGEIEEKLIGTFSHYPLKLAWAITVHKSQGLTFDQAIIDVSGAFAPGQVYVALSRLTSLEGLLLNSPIKQNGLEQDQSVKSFSELKQEASQLQSNLKIHSHDYIKQIAIESFDLTWLIKEYSYHLDTYTKSETRSAKQKYYPWAKEIRDELLKVKEVADKFMNQLKFIFHKHQTDYLPTLEERVNSALKYFEPIFNDLSKTILDQVNEISKDAGVKKYTRELGDVEAMIFRQLVSMQKVKGVVKAVIENKEFSKTELTKATSIKKREEELSKSGKKKKAKKIPKEKKPNTKEVSFALYKEGWSIEQIAKERSFAESTIEGHLAHYVTLGEIKVEKFLGRIKLNQIIQVSETIEPGSLSAIKAKLGDEFTYSDIRFAMAHKKFTADKSKN